MPSNWNDRRKTFNENDPPKPRRQAPTPVKESAKTMPHISDEFMLWLRGVMIPSRFGSLEAMTAEGALKQVAFAEGVLWLKAVIFTARDQAKNAPINPVEITDGRHDPNRSTPTDPTGD